MTKHVIRRLDRSGDTEVAEWSPNEITQIKSAEDVFNALRLGTGDGQKHLMYATPDPQKDSVELKTFDPEATEIIAVPQLVGG